MELIDFDIKVLEKLGYSDLKKLEGSLEGYISLCEVECTFIDLLDESPIHREILVGTNNLKKVLTVIEKREMSVHIDTKFGEKICLN